MKVNPEWVKVRKRALAWLVVAARTNSDPRTMLRSVFREHSPAGVCLRPLERYGGLGAMKDALRTVLGDDDLGDIRVTIDMEQVADDVVDLLFEADDFHEQKPEPTPDPVQAIRDQDREKARQAARKELVRRLDRAEARLAAHEAMGQQGRASVLSPPVPSAGKRTGRVILLLSDWHPGDEVFPDKVNGLNSFNQAILTERVAALIRGFRWTLEMWRTQYDLVELVVGVLGDMVTGWIHEEQLASTSMTPPEEVVFGADLLHDAMEQILEEGFPAVHVVCIAGNHGRTTKRIHHSNRGTTSYEWILYHDLRRRVQADDPGVSFAIPDSEFAYENIGPLTVRFAHGDFFRYSNGVGGITIPMNKALYRQDQARKADLTCMGHWHQYMSLPNVALNGTLKGYDSFSQHCGFSPEPPSQTVILVDERRGFPWAKRLWV